jgi:hypothetical protein
MLREDPQIPWALRPLMPWGIYVLPVLALIATSLLLNPPLNAPAPVGAARLALAVCGSFAIASSLGMMAQWIIISQKKAAATVQREAVYQDENVRRIVAEVEALDPVKDLGRLLGYTSASNFAPPRELAQKKISDHPGLQQELALKLTNEWSLEALGYLELNEPPDPAALAAPVRIAVESLTPWIQRELGRGTQFWPESYYSQIRMALAVVDKFTRYGVDYMPAVKQLRAAFDHPNAKQSNLDAPRLIDAWLASHAAAGSSGSVNPRR